MQNANKTKYQIYKETNKYIWWLSEINISKKLEDWYRTISIILVVQLLVHTVMDGVITQRTVQLCTQ